jgi:hypothetical protein
LATSGRVPVPRHAHPTSASKMKWPNRCSQSSYSGAAVSTMPRPKSTATHPPSRRMQVCGAQFATNSVSCCPLASTYHFYGLRLPCDFKNTAAQVGPRVHGTAKTLDNCSGEREAAGERTKGVQQVCALLLQLSVAWATSFSCTSTLIEWPT